ncbi:Hid-1 family protein [Smittium culicis]|uniref:Hid-1 family protein n=1 Tax=Smittium culicis TaxID=133412 RepID=A0A1R1Y1J7_9FUNG|nr:Hid-1 family protein [Smittium culicis]OMJ27959.1 Hid-1 family protein [Smittium culicis]
MGGQASKLEFRKRVFYLSENRVFDKLSSLLDSKPHPKDLLKKKQLLNCIRVLTRLTPYIYEDTSSRIEDLLFWNLSKTTPNAPQISISSPGIGYQLAEVSLLLFSTPGFSVSDSELTNPKDSKSADKSLENNLISKNINNDSSIKYPIWTFGIGVPTPTLTTLSSNAEIFSNRAEILQLFLALSSKEIYYRAQNSVKVENKILEYIVTHSNNQLILSLLCSLINTSLKLHKKKVFNFAYKPDLGSIDPDILCSIYSSQLLSVLMGASLHQNKNKIYLFISKIHRPQEFEFIIKNSIQILNSALDSSISILATVTQAQNSQIELLSSVISTLLLISECNSDFSNYLGDHNEATLLFVLLSRFLLMYRGQSVKNGLCKIIVYLLRKLSEVKSFSVNMMQPFFNYYSLIPIHLRPLKNSRYPVSTIRSNDATINSSINNSQKSNSDSQKTSETTIQSNYAEQLDEPETTLVISYIDFLIQYTYSVVSESDPTMKPIYTDLFIAIRNISPHITNLSLYSIKCLFLMFEVFSSPAFIVVDRTHVQWLQFLLESFYSIIKFHLSDNPLFTYQLLFYSKNIRKLVNFDYDEALYQLSNIKKAKETNESKRNILEPLTSPTPPIIKTKFGSKQTTPENIGDNLGSLSISGKGKQKVDITQISSNQNTTKSLNEIKEVEKNDSEKSTPKSTLSTLSKNQVVHKQNQMVSKEDIESLVHALPTKQILVILDSLIPHVQKIKDDYLTELNEQSDSEKDLGVIGFEEQSISEIVINFLSNENIVNFVPFQNKSNSEDDKLIKPIQLFFYSANGKNPSGGYYLINFKTIIWVRIFIVGTKPLGLFNGSNIKLFLVKQA